MRELPYEWDFDSLEATELSRAGPEFISNPTREQFAAALQTARERRAVIDAAVPAKAAA